MKIYINSEIELVESPKALTKFFKDVLPELEKCQDANVVLKIDSDGISIKTSKKTFIWNS